MNKRGSGVLLHISSLPSPYGIGDFGPQAHLFADFLSETRQSYWQVLPLNPTAPQRDFSPYSSISSFALDPLFISPELLLSESLADKEEIIPPSSFSSDHTEYEKALEFKMSLLDSAFRRALERGLGPDFHLFCQEHSLWLDNHALYLALSSYFNGEPWSQWPAEIRNRDPAALKNAAADLSREILKEKFIQFLLLHQWNRLKNYCHSRGIQIIGDLPMFVSLRKFRCMGKPLHLQLDEQLEPLSYAGVPPDRFSGSGQLWHNPVYNWEILSQSNYSGGWNDSKGLSNYLT
jgi:4-alpha-glucanotransferase